MTPDFIIVGAMKCGTTTLYDDLARHPQFHLPALKEPDILLEAQSASEATTLYARHFGAVPDGALTGEASTAYTKPKANPAIAGAAREWLGPDIRIIYVTRDPVARIESQLAHEYMKGILPDQDFETHLKTFARFREISHFDHQIAPWVAHFGAANILHLRLEDMITDRAAALGHVLRFLGADPALMPPRETVSNARDGLRTEPGAFWYKIGNSRFYKYRIRPLLPQRVIAAIFQMLTSSRPLPDKILSDETIADLRAEFAQTDAKLAAVLSESKD